MTSGKVRRSITAGIIALTAIGSILGVFTGIYILPRILSSLLADYGIVELPLVMNWEGITLVSLVSILVASLASWLASKEILRTSPRILVIE